MTTTDTYTLYVGDLLTGVILGAAPLNGAKYGSVINGAGAFNGTLLLSDPLVQQAGLAGYLAGNEGKATVFVDRNGVLEWGGILWTTRYQSSTKQLAVGASSFWS